MSKLFTKAGLLAGFVLMLGIVGQAQVSQHYRAQVPFDFQVNDVSYSAGDYSVGRLSSNTNTGALGIRDRKTGKLQIIGQARLGSEAIVANSKLVFVRERGGYTLSEIVTPSFELKLNPTKTRLRISKNTSAADNTVAIALTQ